MSTKIGFRVYRVRRMWQSPRVPPDFTPRRDPRIPDLVSLTEAAEIIGVSRAAIHKMVLAGRLEGAQVGTTWVFRRTAVESHRHSIADGEVDQ